MVKLHAMKIPTKQKCPYIRTYVNVYVCGSPLGTFHFFRYPQPYCVPLSTGVSHFPIFLSFSYLLRISCACILHSRKFSKFSIYLYVRTYVHVSKALVPLKLSALCDKSTYLCLSLSLSVSFLLLSFSLSLALCVLQFWNPVSSLLAAC